MKNTINKVIYISILCLLASCMTGCTIEVPQYWQDRCEPLDFHGDARLVNPTWEEVEKKSLIFDYVPEFNTENCIFQFKEIYMKAVSDPEILAEAYIKELEKAGFTTELYYEARNHSQKCYTSKLEICEDFDNHPVYVVVTINFFDYIYKEQYNLIIDYKFSQPTYESYLKKQKEGSN